MRNGDTLEQLGILLWGQDWKPPMQDALGVGERIIRRGRAGQELPDGIWKDLARLARERAQQLLALADRIDPQK